MTKYKWVEGERFQLLTFLRHDPGDKRKAFFQCECGTVKSMEKYQVRHGTSLSCGCMKGELIRDKLSHGYRHRKVYKAWRSVCSGKCKNTGSIKDVDPSWIGEGGFFQFLEDMGNPPSADSWLARINVSEPYSKNNCTWATIHEPKHSVGMYKNNTSGVKGVSYNKGSKQWQGCIRSHGARYRKVFPGTDEGLAAAEAWVRQLREQLHGKFCNHG
jgi:hypothetical protein